jgi:hypothetical protein
MQAGAGGLPACEARLHKLAQQAPAEAFIYEVGSSI